MALTQLAVQTDITATLLVAEQPPSADSRRSIIIQNLGPNAIYIGDATVTTSTGLKVVSNGVLTIGSAASSAIYAIADGVAQISPANTRCLVESGVN